MGSRQDHGRGGEVGPAGSPPTNSFDTVFANAFQDIANRYNQSVVQKNQIAKQIDSVVARYRPYYNLYQDAIKIGDGVKKVLDSVSKSVRDVYNRYAPQPFAVKANPAVLTVEAEVLRRGANKAKADMNKLLSGEIWAHVRDVANSFLQQYIYSTADTMSNLEGAISRSRGK